MANIPGYQLRRRQAGSGNAPAGRPLSNWAQITQSSVAACALVGAIVGFVYTVYPMYTKQRAEEEAAKLHKEANALRAEIAAYKADLPSFVAKQLVARSLATGADLLRTREIAVEGIKSPSSSSSWQDIGSPLELYAKQGVAAPGSELSQRVPQGLRTGRDVVEYNLKSPELSLLADDARNQLIKTIRTVITNDPVFSEMLVFDVTSLPTLPDNKRYYEIPENDQKYFNRRIEWEGQRQETAHIKFIDGMLRLKVLLLTKL